jgi:hypothetical protein
VEVVFPSRLPLREQLQRFRSAHVIIGVDGSGVISAASQLCDGMALVLIGTYVSGAYTMHAAYLSMLSLMGALHVKFLHSYLDAPSAIENATHVNETEVASEVADLLARVGTWPPKMPPCVDRFRFFLDGARPSAADDAGEASAGSATPTGPGSDLVLKSVDHQQATSHSPVSALEDGQFSHFEDYVEQKPISELAAWRCLDSTPSGQPINEPT